MRVTLGGGAICAIPARCAVAAPGRKCGTAESNYRTLPLCRCLAAPSGVRVGRLQEGPSRMSDRISRKEIKHDKFVDEMATAYQVARKNVPVLLGVAIGALVLVALLIGGWFYMARQESAGQARLAEAIMILEAPLTQPGQPAGPGGSYATEEAKIAAAEPILREVSTEFEGRDAADVADLYLARLEVGRGELPAARARYENFVNEHPDHVLSQAARVSLYEIRIASGETEQALADLEKEVSDTEGSLPQDVALTLLARAYEAADQPEKAREAWQRVVNEFPDSPYTLEAQRKLARG